MFFPTGLRVYLEWPFFSSVSAHTTDENIILNKINKHHGLYIIYIEYIDQSKYYFGGTDI